MDESSDENMDVGEVKEAKTTRALGFRVQKELWFNRHLPYADDQRMDAESQRLLEAIKRNMAKALVQKEMNPGLGICAAQLMRYCTLDRMCK